MQLRVKIDFVSKNSTKTRGTFVIIKANENKTLNVNCNWEGKCKQYRMKSYACTYAIGTSCIKEKVNVFNDKDLARSRKIILWI